MKQLGSFFLILLMMVGTASAQMIAARTRADCTPAAIASSLCRPSGSQTQGNTTFASDTTAPSQSPWWPTRKGGSDAAKDYWMQADKDPQTLKAAQFVGSNGSMSAATEVLSDFLGGGRIALSTAVASSSDETTTTSTGAQVDATKNINLLLANGGNLALTYEYPLFYKEHGPTALRWHGYWRAATNINAFGNNVAASSPQSEDLNKTRGMTELGSYAVEHLHTASNLFEFEVVGKLSGITGTKEFATALASSHRTFLHLQLGGNVKINNLISLGLAVNRYSGNALPKKGAVLTVGMSR